jgi:hypothetical protein
MTKILSLLALLACLAPSLAAAQGLGASPAIFTSGDWTVRKSKDAMTDKVSCTGLYLKRFDVQLDADSLYISLRGRGGVQGYTLRLDDRPAGRIQLASHTEKQVSALGITGTVFKDLLGAQRLRASIITVLNSQVQEDISLVGVPEAYAVITGPECK